MTYTLFVQRSPMAWAIVFLIALNAFTWAMPHIFAPVPYRNVDVRLSYIEGNEYRLVANFDKTDCRFERLTVVGFSLGQSFIMEWEDMDGLPQDYDRDRGRQTLRLKAPVGVSGVDLIEVRTRHLCDGEVTDRMFSVYPPEVRE